MRRLAMALAAAALVVGGAPARAQLPVTITPDLFPFPGTHHSPGSAVSAGLAIADRWLGEEPFDNPAASRPSTLALSPMILHVSRQDLRADHRSYEEQSAFFDAAGGFFSLQRGRLGLALYGYQPVVRLEDNLFLTGSTVGPSGSVQSNSSAREFRGGLALSLGPGRWRFGIAGEWTQRVDHYERSEKTGGPDYQTHTADFSGGGVGGQAGFRLSTGEGPGALTLGGAVRYVPELDLTGDESVLTTTISPPSTATTTTPIATLREAGWEGGLSLRYAVTEAFRALAAAGGRTAQEYRDWDVQSGSGAEWKLAGEYHDRRDAWTVRFGLGQEHQTDVPEPRAAVVGLGIGLQLESTQVDFGIVHRSFKRADHPASVEDRVVLSLVQRF